MIFSMMVMISTNTLNNSYVDLTVMLVCDWYGDNEWQFLWFGTVQSEWPTLCTHRVVMSMKYHSTAKLQDNKVLLSYNIIHNLK